MKRKFKLFATIASLCLSVALMAFGVYAATSATYHVTSSVKFAAQIAGYWEGATEGGISGVKTDGITSPGDNNHYNGSEASASDEWAVGELEFGTANNTEKAITYTIKFHNESDTAADIAMSVADSKLFDVLVTPDPDYLTVVISHKAGASGTAENLTASDFQDGVLKAASQKQAPVGDYYELTIAVTLIKFDHQIPDAYRQLDITLTATPHTGA